MAIHLIPRETSFDALATRRPRAASALMASAEPPDPGGAREAVWGLVERLDKAFLTPFDREDISWNVAARMVWVWGLTLPCCAAIAAAIWWLMGLL